MKSLLAVIFLAAILLGAWWLFFKTDSTGSQPKQESIKVSRHTSEFNESVSQTVMSYLAMKDAFVDADTAKVKTNGQGFITTIDNLKLTDLQKEDPKILAAVRQEISDIKVNAEAMLQEKDITEMRQDFRMVSENLYPFLKTIGYEGEKLYWQNCPMAFGENKEGNWISNTKEIINPYLGRNHPEFKSSMLNCGETKDTLK
ncbi:MAG: DUF3347 domain-containing protein [Bacteroidota bacterium]|nr:DUF3347 domain-containing protein [Bacteroidota bacterium]